MSTWTWAPARREPVLFISEHHQYETPAVAVYEGAGEIVQETVRTLCQPAIKRDGAIIHCDTSEGTAPASAKATVDTEREQHVCASLVEHT